MFTVLIKKQRLQNCLKLKAEVILRYQNLLVYGIIQMQIRCLVGYMGLVNFTFGNYVCNTDKLLFPPTKDKSLSTCL